MKQEIIHIDLNGVNCYLAKSEEGFILFDTAGHLTMDKEYSDRRQELVRHLEESGCRPGNLKAVILTHGDNDHTANAVFLRDKYQTVIAMHGDDIDLVKDVTIDKMMESFRFRSVILKLVFHFIKKKIRRIITKTFYDFVQFSPDVILKEGDDLSKYGFSAKILHLPGHTPGSIGILFESGELISGDIFINMKRPELAMNAADFKQLKMSVNRLKPMNITTVYPGHGKPFAAIEAGIGNRQLNGIF